MFSFLPDPVLRETAAELKLNDTNIFPEPSFEITSKQEVLLLAALL